MSKDKVNQNENENQNENDNQGLARRESQAVAIAQPFNAEMWQMNAELEKSLKQLSVSSFISPTVLLPSSECEAVSELFNMVDCFDFEIQEKGDSKTVCMYICDFNGEIKAVAQSLAGSREKYITAFNNARVNRKDLTLTNLRFRRLSTGKKSGNYPIVVEFTGKTQPILKDKA